jgi:4-alpha-glucanotransferase
VTDAELIGRAEAAGISASYLDWRKRRVQVPDQTLKAILDALGQAGDDGAEPAPPGGLAGGPVTLPRRPHDRSWGFTVQLYSVRSRLSWGHGDFRDLAELATWSARELGADFIQVNPLHAAEPAPPVSDSPYLPMTRHYVSALYLRIEDIPEYQRLTRTQRQEIAELAGPLKAASRTPDLIDRDRVWAAKRAALDLIRSAGMSQDRRSDFERYKREQGGMLANWANWCALAQVHGPDWRRWPTELADPRRVSRLMSSGPLAGLAGQADFHAWLQWLADAQLAAVQQAALAAGMSIGLIADLAVGVNPGGADAWAQQDLLVHGISVGAPPDGFNQRGQDWAQLPFNPRRLASTEAQPFAELLRASLRHAGGLRIDHVMGLMRLWWVPEGCSPDQGTYVSYDHRLMAGTLATEAAKAGAVAIGEDLGTVDPWIRQYLASQHILGTEMAWFATSSDGSPLPPARWRKWVMATVGTHDVPPAAGFLAGDQVTVRARLGLLSNPEAERVALEQTLARWHAALARLGLLPAGASHEPSVRDITVALYGYLALTPSVLTGVALVDAVGDRRTQNIPGTCDEYPNWRIPLCDSEGRAVLIEDLPDLELVTAVVNAARNLARRRVLFPALQRPDHVVAAFAEQAGQGAGRADAGQVGGGVVDGLLADQGHRVTALGEELCHVRTPVPPLVRDNGEELRRVRREQVFLIRGLEAVDDGAEGRVGQLTGEHLLPGRFLGRRVGPGGQASLRVPRARVGAVTLPLGLDRLGAGGTAVDQAAQDLPAQLGIDGQPFDRL